MSSVDVVQGLAGHHEEDKADEDPGYKDVSIVAVFINYVTEAEDVELLLSSVARSIDREQNRPGYAAANEADDDRDLEITK